MVKQCPRLYLRWEENLPLAMQEVRSQIHDTFPVSPPGADFKLDAM